MKFILKFLGVSLILVGLWYVIIMFTSQGQILNSHLDLAAMIQRFNTRWDIGYSPNFTTITALISDCKETLLLINSVNPAKALADGMLGNFTQGWSDTASVIVSFISPTFAVVSSLTMLGYAIAIIFQFIGIMFYSIEPFLQFLFEPIFV